MNKKEISLKEAMRNFKPTKYSIWFSSGDIIESKFKKNGGVSRIGISRLAEKSGYSVTTAIHDGENSLVIHDLGNFSSLDKLKNYFPQLFEVTGNFYVY